MLSKCSGNLSRLSQPSVIMSWFSGGLFFFSTGAWVPALRPQADRLPLLEPVLMRIRVPLNRHLAQSLEWGGWAFCSWTWMEMVAPCLTSDHPRTFSASQVTNGPSHSILASPRKYLVLESTWYFVHRAWGGVLSVSWVLTQVWCSFWLLPASVSCRLSGCLQVYWEVSSCRKRLIFISPLSRIDWRLSRWKALTIRT